MQVCMLQPLRFPHTTLSLRFEFSCTLNQGTALQLLARFDYEAIQAQWTYDGSEFWGHYWCGV